ncbi:MAG: leucine-rich repeat protein [Clostridia bacterium]|nr:leucine-rich repeat protein [Clostridia bacterium]
MKKTVSLILALIMCFGVMVYAFASTEVADDSMEITDIEANEITAIEEQLSLNVGTKEITSSGSTLDGLVYSIVDNSYAVITGYTGSPTDVVIPSEINGCTVMTIGEGAFSNCASLTSVKMPYGLTNVERDAFLWCESLTNVELSDSVRIIREYAFNGTGLRNIVIPNGVMIIDYAAFGSCSIENINIPDSVEDMDYAFAGGNSLKSIEVSENNSNYCDVDGVLFNKSRTTIVQYPCGRTDESYTIPNGVINISGDAFNCAFDLKKIEIPSSVKSIGAGAFAFCTSLANIELPKGLTSLEHDLFDACTSLTHIEIPEGVTEIQYFVFEGCSALESVIIPASVTNIDESAFNLSYDSNLVIYGMRGSRAESYAKENNITFIAIDESKPTSMPEATVKPTIAPTVKPTVAPTENPTVAPTENPTVVPTENPTVAPTVKPTVKPETPKTGSTKLAVVVASVLVLAAVVTTTGVLVKKED